MNIFKQLPYSHLFLLSICSLRIQKLIRNLRFNGSASFIRYTLRQNRVGIDIGNKQNIDEMQHMADFMNYFYHNRDGHQACTISDLNVNFGVTVPTDDKIKDYFVLVHPDVKVIIPAVQKHIHSFFQTPVPSRLAIVTDEYLPGLPKIDGVEESSLSGENLEGTFLECFFKTYPNQTRCKIVSKNVKKLEKNSKLFDLDCLCIRYSSENAPMILKHFTGSHLFLFSALLKMEDVMQFFQKWKSGEAYQNLEYLCIRLKSGQLFGPEVTIQLEAKPWDQTKRPMYFNRSPKVLEWFAAAEIDQPLNCEGFLDIEREDGKLASIGVNSDYLQICVWTDSQLNMDNNS